MSEHHFESHFGLDQQVWVNASLRWRGWVVGVLFTRSKVLYQVQPANLPEAEPHLVPSELVESREIPVVPMMKAVPAIPEPPMIALGDQPREDEP